MLPLSAHMHQKHIAKSKEREDDKLPSFDKKNMRLGADAIIIAKEHESFASSLPGASKSDDRRSGSGDNSVLTVGDFYSGCGAAVPLPGHGHDACYKCLKDFVGPRVAKWSPNIIVKSDAATSITGAVEELGWFSEPSLANRWPHNAIHERWIRTLKSVIRASMQGSGLPFKAWSFAVAHAVTSLNIHKTAPKHPWEKDCLLYTSPSPRD